MRSLYLWLRIKAIAVTRVRYGYRRIQVLLRREGWAVSTRECTDCREMGLQLRNKTPKERVKAKLREDPQSATQANETWAMDFVHDQLATGHKFRVPTMVDTFSRYAPAIEPRFNFRGADVVPASAHWGTTMTTEQRSTPRLGLRFAVGAQDTTSQVNSYVKCGVQRLSVFSVS